MAVARRERTTRVPGIGAPGEPRQGREQNRPSRGTHPSRRHRASHGEFLSSPNEYAERFFGYRINISLLQTAEIEVIDARQSHVRDRYD
jgi:hypothetical protein